MSEWPEDFSINDGSEAALAIRAFIEAQLQELKAFDEKRAEWVKANMPKNYHMTYRFYDHTHRVAADVKATVLHMGLSETVAENMYWAMLPHDIGKKLLPVYIWDILEKPEDDIKHLRRSHTELGAKVVAKELKAEHPFVTLMTDIILNHHEQMDGRGFRGLRAPALSKPVRLAAIVEGFDGWSTRRPHFAGRDITVPSVLKRMREEKGATMFDMELLEAFSDMKMKQYKDKDNAKPSLRA